MPNYILAFSDASIPLRLYVLEDPSGSTPSWSAFLLSKQSNHQENHISLDDAWDENGHFLFSYTAPALTTAYLDALQTFLIQSTAQRVKKSISFLLDPSAAPNAESIQVIPIFQKATNDFRLDEPTLFDIGNGYTQLQVGPNDVYESVRVDAKTHGQYGELQLTMQSSHPISLHLNGVLLSNQTSFPISVPVIGPGAGGIRFILGLKGTSNLDQIDLGQKYFFPDESGFAELQYPFVKSSPDQWELQFQVSIDPTDLVNKKYADPLIRRTYLAFTGTTIDTNNVTENNSFPTILDSHFYTAAGYEVKLHPYTDTFPTEAEENTFYPTDRNACLVFSERDTEPESNTPFYLTPSGNFLIEVVPQAGQDAVENGRTKWLVGLSGLETMDIRVKEGNQNGYHLRFLANKPAYAPKFPRVAASHLNRPDPNPALQPRFETAWANIISYENEDVVYYSQPEGGSLYVRDAETNTDGLLDFFEMGVRISPDPLYAFPMVPHGGVQTQVEQIAQLADEVLSPSRKEIINALGAEFEIQTPPSVAAGNLIDSVSPQGLLTNLATNGQWKEVVLAQHYELYNYSDLQYLDLADGLPSNNPPNFKLSFLNLPRPLQDALQANQLFLPMTDLTGIGMQCFDELGVNTVAEEAVFNNKMVVKEWPFQINVGKRYKLGDYNNVLIFKFCRGKLSDWVKNPKQWIQAADFNIVNADHFELHLLSRWLQDYFAEAQNEADNPYFAYFNSIIDDPNWTGILALKVDVDAEEFPDQLKGLVAGIGLDKFNAHHLGIEINHIDTTADLLTIEDSSSIFGLIYYMDSVYKQQIKKNPEDVNRPVPAAPGDYDFKVLTLQVLFENTAIKDFASKIQVSMRSVFGEEITEFANDIVEDPQISLLLDGAYEEKNGAATYTFQTETPTKLWVDSNVLNFFEMERASFQTFPNPDPDDTRVESRFNFSGNLNFRFLGDPAEPFDILSFGSVDGEEATESRKGLIFRNLLLGMEFDLTNPSLVAYGLDTSTIAFDPNNSPLREDTALFGRFPLDYRKFIFGKDQSPEDLGYLTAFTPNLATTALGDQWYGIDFNLELGSAGALAESAGFQANFLVAWSPGSSRSKPSYPVFVGVKLPGSGGNAKLLSLQSVVKLSIADIDFLFENGAYVLKLNDIGLKFFGLLKLPPSGNTSFYLFGDPNATDKPKNLGWYAAYNKISEDQD